MSWVISIIGNPGQGCEYEQPCYLKAYDNDAFDGLGSAEATADVGEAMRFNSQAEAFTAWRSQSTVRPIRGDGRPNRPLTAFSVEISEVP